MAAMIARTRIIFDCNYLAYAEYYALGAKLDSNGAAWGVVFGFLGRIASLSNILRSPDLVFAFDHGPLLREQVLPSYKETRRKKLEAKSQSERDAVHQFRVRVSELRDDLLGRFGYANILHEEGFEADDMIAAAVNTCRWIGDNAIIVSADQDLYQLLRPGVKIYNPANRRRPWVTHDTFTAEWGLAPSMWGRVKAIAGCATDDVPGVPGVGEKKAAAYIRGDMPTHHAAHAAITAALPECKQRYRDLIKLPHWGAPTVTFDRDTATRAIWSTMMRECGFPSLVDKFPVLRG